MRVRPVVDVEEVLAPELFNGVITRMDLVAGRPIVTGDYLFSLDGRPVVAVAGSFPFYREIRYRDEGDDVVQLQEILVADGESIEVDGIFGPATQRALEQFYDRRGLSAPHGEGADPAEIRSLRAALRSAESDVVGRQLELDTLRADSPGDAMAISQAELDLERALAMSQEARARLSEAILNGGAILRPQELWVRTHPDPTPTRVLVAVGDMVVGGTPLWQSGGRVASFVGLVDEQTLERIPPDSPAVIADVPGVGDLPAVVSAVQAGKKTTGPDGSVGTDESSSLVEVVLKTNVELSVDLDPERTYRAELELEGTQGEVLAVPLAALTDGTDSEVAVSVVDSQTSGELRTHLVDVEVGVVAQGFVEVAPRRKGELKLGDRVVVGLSGGEAVNGAG
ncbi:MAG TPA: peptidoglycan-binding protein [Acidimicrobiales bacterium]|nr:peptidoglycan-binding protein [Acidimicrobiales bacterium]